MEHVSPATLAMALLQFDVNTRDLFGELFPDLQELVDMPCLWRDVQALANLDDTNLPEIVDKMRRREILHVRIVSSEAGLGKLREVFQAQPLLQSVDFTGIECPLPETILEAALPARPWTTVSAVSVAGCTISDLVVRTLAENFPNLEYLGLGRCSGLTNASLHTISDSMHKLVNLDVSACGFTELYPLANARSQLRRLDVSHIDSVTVEFVEGLGANQSNLISLRMASCNLSEHHISPICQNFARIRELILRSSLVTDNCVRMLSTEVSTTLRVLDLGFCANLTEDAFQQLGGRLREVTCLRIPGLKITNAALSSLAENLPGIVVLDVSKTQDINKVGMLAVGKKLHALKRISVASCPALCNASLRAILQARAVESINISECPRVTCVGNLFDNPALTVKEIDLSGCQVGDTGIKFLVKGLPALKYLAVNRCPVSDHALQSIASHLKSLNTLKMAACHIVTNEGLFALAKLRNLKLIDISDCIATSKAGRDYLRDKLPGLSFL